MAALSMRVDEASPTVTYVGEAAVGTPEASPNWRIKKLEQSGSVLVITYADGNLEWNSAWTARAGLSYS